MFTTSLLPSILLSLSVAALPLQVRESTPGVTLPFALNLKLNGSTLPELDRARATLALTRGKQIEDSLKNNTKDSSLTELTKRAASIDATNTGVTYITSVGVGSPATTYPLLIDTGSSNIWIGAKKSYARTNTSTNTGKKFSINYGSGSVTGYEYIDTVSLSTDLTVTKQSIGVASSSTGMTEADGILGIGPVALTSGTVQDTFRVPTISDNLYSQKKISVEVIGISYNPDSSSAHGELTFGGTDSSKYTDSITYTPITKSSPAKYYWGIDQTVTYGSSNSPVLSSTSGIVDTGTTLVLLATDAYNRYKNLTGATVDAATGLLKIMPSQYSNLQSLYFTIGGRKFELTADAQIWPRQFNRHISGSSDDVYLIVSDLGSQSGQGINFINGYTFLQRFYSVYDTTNSRVGLATTSYTYTTSN